MKSAATYCENAAGKWAAIT